MVLRGLDDILHALSRTDVTWINAQARGACLGGLDRALVVKVNIRNHRYVCAAHYCFESCRRVLVRARYADDVATGLLNFPDLVDGSADVASDRIGHGLDADRGVAADNHRADVNLL